MPAASLLLGTIPVDYSILPKAVLFAVEQHAGQTRIEPAGPVAYAIHPLRVCEHLRWIAGCEDMEILCAAILHDTIEDSGTRYDEIAQNFGDRVASIVSELTNDSRLPKERRHQEMIERIARISPEAKLIKLADRYDNLLSVSSATKFERLRRETPLLMESLVGICPELELRIDKLLSPDRQFPPAST